jgi:hypothetical protein
VPTPTTPSCPSSLLAYTPIKSGLRENKQVGRKQKEENEKIDEKVMREVNEAELEEKSEMKRAEALGLRGWMLSVRSGGRGSVD